MNKSRVRRQRWSTSSSGVPVDTSPVELAALKEHLERCEHQRGALFGLQCAGDAVSRFMVPRVVTILVAFVLLGALASLLL